MTEEQRRLLLARQTWRSMQPAETEVLRAANRIATRFSPKKSLSFGRRVRMVSGGLATIAGIAYAGSGAWSEIAGKWGRGWAGRTLTDEATPAALVTSSPGELRSSGPHDPKPERTGVVPEHLEIDMPAPAPVESAAKPRKKAPRPVARVRRTEPTESKELVASTDRVDPTWADVNGALSAHDYARAESLLLQLADGWHDADTRAKAHLGLAQLAAARGECERARVLALGVAATSGIEMKTVRRALELAVRCVK